jgi:hypothetical protein
MLLQAKQGAEIAAVVGDLPAVLPQVLSVAGTLDLVSCGVILGQGQIGESHAQAQEYEEDQAVLHGTLSPRLSARKPRPKADLKAKFTAR